MKKIIILSLSVFISCTISAQHHRKIPKGILYEQNQLLQIKMKYELNRTGAYTGRATGAQRHTIAFDVESNIDSELPFTIGIGYPIWISSRTCINGKEREGRMIFAPLLYFNISKPKGIGGGFVANYDDEKFLIETTIRFAVGKKASDFLREFYNYDLITGAYKLTHKFYTGIEFEVAAIPEDAASKVSTFLGPTISYKITKEISIEGGWLYNFVQHKNSKGFISLIIE